jgi:hypothetical protein
MVLPLTKLRTAIAVLGVLASCLLVAPAAEAAPAHRAHGRGRCPVCRRLVSPKQAFKRIATRRPDRLIRRHVTVFVRKARTHHGGASDETAIQTVSTVTVEADAQASPALEPLGLLFPDHTAFRTHDGFARRPPRGPPALS